MAVAPTPSHGRQTPQFHLTLIAAGVIACSGNPVNVTTSVTGTGAVIHG